MIRVVSGAFIREGRVLMGLRKATGLRPSLWELPGDKVEPGELPGDAALLQACSLATTHLPEDREEILRLAAMVKE